MAETQGKLKNEVLSIILNNGTKQVVRNRRVRVGSIYLKPAKGKADLKTLFQRTEGDLPQVSGMSSVYGWEVYNQSVRLGKDDMIWLRATAQANGMTHGGFLNVLIRSAREEMGDL